MNLHQLADTAWAFGRAQRDALKLVSDFCADAGIGLNQQALAQIFEGDLDYWTDAMHGCVDVAGQRFFVAHARLGYYGADVPPQQRGEWEADAHSAKHEMMEAQNVD